MAEETGTMRQWRAGRWRRQGFLAGQVVENDHVALEQWEHKSGGDVESEHLAIHYPVNKSGCVHPVMARRVDKGQTC